MENVSSSLARLPSSEKLGCPGKEDHVSLSPACSRGSLVPVIVSQVGNPERKCFCLRQNWSLRLRFSCENVSACSTPPCQGCQRNWALGSGWRRQCLSCAVAVAAQPPHSARLHVVILVAVPHGTGNHPVLGSVPRGGQDKVGLLPCPLGMDF